MRSVSGARSRGDRACIVGRDAAGNPYSLADVAAGAVAQGATLYLCESDRDPRTIEELAPWPSVVACHLPTDYPLGRLAEDIGAVPRVRLVRDFDVDGARALATVEALERVAHLSLQTGTLRVLIAPPYKSGWPRTDATEADIDGELEPETDEASGDDVRGLIPLLPSAIAWDPRRVMVDEERPDDVDAGLQPVAAFLATVKPAPPIVEGLLHGGGVSLVFGREGTHKTRLLLDLALHVAQGREDWHGRRLFLKGPVALLLGEGEYAIPTRLAAWGRHHGADPARLPLYLRAGVNLADPARRERYLAELATARPVLTVVDTLSSTTSGLDENSKELQPVLDWCREVHRRTGGDVAVIHHAGHKAGDRARGWSGLQANVDAVLRVRRPRGGGDGAVMVDPRKLRAMRPGAPLRLRVQVVDLGPDPERPDHRLEDGVLVRDTVRGAEAFEALVAACREAGGELPLDRAAEVVARERGIEPKSARTWIARKLASDTAEVAFWSLRLEGEAVVHVDDEE